MPISMAHVRCGLAQDNGIMLLEDGSVLGPSRRVIA